MMIDVNPQEVLILAEEMLRAGWIRGREAGRRTGFDGGQDPEGVCVVGALRASLHKILEPQILVMLQPLPEFQALRKSEQPHIVKRLTSTRAQELLQIFRSRIEATLGPSIRIESWNDSSETTKSDILAAMQASLEVITKECLADWTPTSSTPAEVAAVR
jgi:hypothetical protein